MILLDTELTDFGVYVDSDEYINERKDKLTYILEKRDEKLKSD